MKKVILTFLMLSISSLAFGAQKTILVIESYNAQYSWDASYMQGLAETVGPNYTITSFEMDTKRVPADQYENRARMAWDKYKQVQPDLVVLGDDNALKFLGPEFVKTTTPTIYLGINNNPRAYLGEDFRKMTGVLEHPLLKRNISDLSTLVKPVHNKVLVLFDSGTTSQVAKSTVFNDQKRSQIGDFTVFLEMIGSWEKWRHCDDFDSEWRKSNFDAMGRRFFANERERHLYRFL